MRTPTKVLVIMSLFFTTIYVAIAHLILRSFKMSLFVGTTSFLVHFLVFDILDRFAARKKKRIMAAYPENAFLKINANAYSPTRLLGNGFLFATEEQFIFVNTESAKIEPIIIDPNDVSSIDYGKIYKHLSGCRLGLTEENHIGFQVTPIDHEKIKAALLKMKYGD